MKETRALGAGLHDAKLIAFSSRKQFHSGNVGWIRQEKNMDTVLDHTFLPANDPQESVRFYTTIMGFQQGENFGPFEVVRVNQDLTLDIAQADSNPELHYAFAMDRETFDAVYDRIKAVGLIYGDGPFSSKNMRGPGKTHGAHGLADSVLFHDPSGHMIEIRSY